MPDPIIIRFKRLFDDAKAPCRLSTEDAGWDLSVHRVTNLDSPTWIWQTGIAVEIPKGYFGLLRPRSSICKTSYAFASSGIIDSSYRGEIGVPLRWVGGGKTYNPGDRIAQLIILPLPDVTFVEVGVLSESARGVGGFGSTGV